MTVDTRVADTHPDALPSITTPLLHPRLVAIPAFTDNYIWALTSADGSACVVVDPGDATVVTRWLVEKQIKLAAILITHHHADHVGGLAALRAPGITVYGPRHEDIAGIDVRVGDGDCVALAEVGAAFTVIDVPGHTSGHVAYVGTLPVGSLPADANDNAPADTSPDNTSVLFCGDTLFSAGCGRLFEGTPAEMFASLSRLAALRSDTLVCCAHEYTLANLRFAAAVEPANADIAEVTSWASARRSRGEATLPSSIARELRVNPFLRADQPAAIAAALQQGALSSAPVDVFTALRRWKDGFR